MLTVFLESSKRLTMFFAHAVALFVVTTNIIMYFCTCEMILSKG